MQRRGVRFAVMAAFAVVAASGHAQTGDWGNLAVISSTMGNYAGRICVGEGLRVGDIGCPTYAPSVTTAGDVSVTGNLSANKFIGDGSLLTGVGQSDRITSGTTNVIATQDGSVTITTSGTQRVVIGENGFVGIGTDSPSTRLQVEGSDFLRAAITQKRDAFQWNHIISANGTYLLRYGDVGVANELFYLMNTGRLGLGTTNPLATTHVSGSLMVSTNGQTSVPSLYADSGKLSVGTTAPSGTIELRGLGNVNLDFTNTDSTGAALVVRDTQPNQQSGGQILLGSSYGLFAGIKSELRSGSGPAGNLVFQTRNTSGDILRRMTVFYDGKVGIGTSATTVPTTLLVSGSFAVSTSTQATTPSLYVGTNGRVGIGTNAPLAKLDVNGTISASDAIQVGDSSLTCGAGTSGALRYSSGNMQFCNGSAWTTLGASSSGLEDRITSGTTNVIATQDRSVTINTAGTQRVIIGENGNVGIGLTGVATPTTALEISGSIRLPPNGAINRNINFGPGYGAAAIYLYDNGASNGKWGWGLNASEMQFFSTNAVNNRFTWNAGGDFQSTGSNELMRLRQGTSGGTPQLGIGTTAPSATLTVSGSAIISGTVQVAGAATETCTPGKLGTIRFNPVTGAPQICVQR